MDYQVPQFIEVEDKIIGPFTLKQFIYLAGGGGLIAIFLLYLPLFFGILLSIPVGALAGALAFYKVNNKSFVEMLEAGFKYYTGGRLFLWKKEEKAAPKQTVVVAPEAPQKLGLSRRRLEDLAWSLDIKDQQPPSQP
ncbi:MAG: PrgI family protein [Patescibacteria group bacterium]